MGFAFQLVLTQELQCSLINYVLKERIIDNNETVYMHARWQGIF